MRFGPKPALRASPGAGQGRVLHLAPGRRGLGGAPRAGRELRGAIGADSVRGKRPEKVPKHPEIH